MDRVLSNIMMTLRSVDMHVNDCLLQLIWITRGRMHVNAAQFVTRHHCWLTHPSRLIGSRWSDHGPLTRYALMRVVHALGMPRTFSPPPRISDPDMHLGTCVTHVPWCMSVSLTSGFPWKSENVSGIPGACTTHNFGGKRPIDRSIGMSWSSRVRDGTVNIQTRLLNILISNTKCYIIRSIIWMHKIQHTIILCNVLT